MSSWINAMVEKRKSELELTIGWGWTPPPNEKNDNSLEDVEKVTFGNQNDFKTQQKQDYKEEEQEQEEKQEEEDEK